MKNVSTSAEAAIAAAMIVSLLYPLYNYQNERETSERKNEKTFFSQALVECILSLETFETNNETIKLISSLWKHEEENKEI